MGTVSFMENNKKIKLFYIMDKKMIHLYVIIGALEFCLLDNKVKVKKLYERKEK